MTGTKKKRVRKPKKSADVSEETSTVDEMEKSTTDDIVPNKVVSPSKDKPVKEVTSPESMRADVTLTECASLTKYGRKFIKGRTFTAFGKEQIDFFKADNRFNVVEK